MKSPTNKFQAVKFQAIKGVRDILPPESALWNRVEAAAREVFETYGYGEIRLPIFEATELFARSIGVATDVVSKEMYTWEDYESSELLEYRNATLTWHEAQLDPARPGPQGVGSLAVYGPFAGLANRFLALARESFAKGQIPRTPENQNLLGSLEGDIGIFYSSIQGRSLRENRDAVDHLKERIRQLEFGDSLTLRPEATASVVRAYIQHGMHTWPSPVRLYYSGPMFRRERPQKGRYRQFYQIGAELLGPSDHAALDAEVIEMLMAFFARIGLAGARLQVNSIGDKNCRPAYVEQLRGELQKVREKLGPDSQRRIDTNPLRVLDSKTPEEQAIIEGLPRIGDCLCAECKEHYAELKRQLALREIAYEENWRLVRGLDYYMRTTFEITAPGLGSQNAICGGGRYDGLVEMLGGPAATKGIGFAIGTDRLVLSLQGQGISAPGQGDVLVGWKEPGSYEHARVFAQFLRGAGLSVDLPIKAMTPGDAIRLANKRGFPICVIVGPDEVTANVYGVRFLADGDQVQMSIGIAQHLGRLLLFRVSLEKVLAKLADVHGIQRSHRTVTAMAEDLARAGVVPGHLLSPIRKSMDFFNRAVHGDETNEEDESRAVGEASFVLNALLQRYRPLISS